MNSLLKKINYEKCIFQKKFQILRFQKLGVRCRHDGDSSRVLHPQGAAHAGRGHGAPGWGCPRQWQGELLAYYVFSFFVFIIFFTWKDFFAFAKLKIQRNSWQSLLVLHFQRKHQITSVWCTLETLAVIYHFFSTDFENFEAFLEETREMSNPLPSVCSILWNKSLLSE